MWLHFSRDEFAVGAPVPAPGEVPQNRQDLYRRQQYRPDRIYVIRASGSQFVSLTEWSGLDRWCYEVEPAMPVDPDIDRTHAGFDSWMCPTATVVRVERTPQRPEPALDGIAARQRERGVSR